MNQFVKSADPGRLIRVPATWYCYFLIGTQIYLFNVQGNVIPFLQSEFALSYRVVSLHSMAIAVGVILMSLVADRVVRTVGRRIALRIGGSGLAVGAILLCLSPGPWASILSCLLVGLMGGLVPSVVPAVLAELHGDRRDQAYAEQAIVAYSFAVLGPIASGYFVSQGLGWRYAVLIGAVAGLTLVAVFRNAALPDAPPRARDIGGSLPAPFWAYWFLMASSCALEFSVLFWGPTFLERVIGFTPAAAATGAAAFFAGVLAGRIALRVVVRAFRPRAILFCAFATGLVGFVLYWAIGNQLAAIAGIFLLGLCVAPQYPLTMALAIGAANGRNDAAAARLTLAFGSAVLVAPAILGALADFIGLRFAHLTLPALIAAGFASFVTAGFLERRAADRPG
jgi:MFS family permease